MSYAIPSLTRVPATEKGLTIARLPRPRPRRRAHLPAHAQHRARPGGGVADLPDREGLAPGARQARAVSRSRTSGSWSSAGPSAPARRPAAFLYVALGPRRAAVLRGGQGRFSWSSARPAATSSASSSPGRSSAGSRSSAGTAGSAGRWARRRSGPGDLRHRRAVARGHRPASRPARPSSRSSRRSSSRISSSSSRRPRSFRRRGGWSAAGRATADPPDPGLYGPGRRPGGSTARRRCSSARDLGRSCSRSRIRSWPRAWTSTPTSGRTRGRGSPGRCAATCASSTGRPTGEGRGPAPQPPPRVGLGCGPRPRPRRTASASAIRPATPGSRSGCTPRSSTTRSPPSTPGSGATRGVPGPFLRGRPAVGRLFGMPAPRSRRTSTPSTPTWRGCSRPMGRSTRHRSRACPPTYPRAAARPGGRARSGGGALGPVARPSRSSPRPERRRVVAPGAVRWDSSRGVREEYGFAWGPRERAIVAGSDAVGAWRPLLPTGLPLVPAGDRRRRPDGRVDGVGRLDAVLALAAVRGRGLRAPAPPPVTPVRRPRRGPPRGPRHPRGRGRQRLARLQARTDPRLATLTADGTLVAPAPRR